MRTLTIVIAVVVALYSGLWFAASTAAEKGALGLIDSLRADGMQVDYATLDVRGFPSRLDTTVTDLNFTNGVIGWQAPFLQMFALTYQPNQIIAVAPPEQVLTLAGDRLTISSSGLRASARVAASTALALDHATVETGPLRVVADSGWAAGVNHAIVAFRQAETAPVDYDFYIDATSVDLPAPLLAIIDPANARDPALRGVTLDLGISLVEPLDRFASGPALITALRLRTLNINWNDTGLTGAGDLTVDDAGIPSGRITLTVRNWPALFDMARAAGLIDPAQEDLFRNMAQTLAEGGNNLDLPITFSDGQMAVSFLPLGPAPRLR
jgi:hypothetical protein